MCDLQRRYSFQLKSDEMQEVAEARNKVVLRAKKRGGKGRLMAVAGL